MEIPKYQQEATEKPLEMATGLAATTYISGADTTLASMQTFFLAIANHPDVQKAVQAEIDAVVGTTRLPRYNDARDLPYTCAVIKEVLRWHPILPLGVAHRATGDNFYQGYLIPKGTIVWPNTWSILQDPEVYPDPTTFNPSRWLIDTPSGIRLNSSIPDADVTFGFGRRICPGRHFAQRSLFITVSNVLACFSISPLDKSGQPRHRLPERFTDGLIVYPEHFSVSITPRSDKVLQLLKEIEL